ncbi:sugar ABC transporter ATP-binding protein [Mesorhizobium sp. M4B.F.Ca.ET.215.01.1.1]|uniref:sugar ABC transporter ATP-binding protein n=1 Tax=unclassified Mesorhizobium TaxID=325217 RepID=UPI000FCC2545|nr:MULTISPECIES: sugar ABC transporter ATP-binding protein [unclassified Mesorhizobium]RUW23019.1 sugar ABC transporter ATP-binding protein [Mesorhizobium sp. M4B.F.Ca.ET.013.02.1.1]RVD34544.1 sugar ABC transporter ATP-binding protein [Mesorhizobium sp. M4B.F.Ca.ET.019.03.1.1]TGQ18749.1 sugar ABC transporter ATP-binding protein [Mesorhizobium sp. M4B.F.Ca.ET.215.01.1.1]TGQ40408.1 sugar ABC transporter ATP-binding protein [Mesorhizobium sp. M4B.F.Ca.ET.214.01.1.1]TGQ48995.1 sugar ABC transporte
MSSDPRHSESPHHGLFVNGLCKSYGPVQVLADASFEVRPGEVVALLGENGAGKSTVSNIIAGSTKPDAGTIIWRGKPYSPANPAAAIEAGVGMIHQELKLLPDLSVAENVYVGRLPMRGGRIDRATMNAKASAQLKRLGLDVSPERKVRTLRIAAQQQVEIAKALTLNAELLILDEPTAALGGEETELLFQQIRKLKAEGMSFIYISHRLDEIAQIADRVVVMRDGRIVARHERADIPVRTVVEQMVGRSVERMFPKLSPPRDETLLEVENLSSPDKSFNAVSFSVKSGEILGIAGLIGAGRTELVRAIAGADPISSGAVHVAGKPVHLNGPAAAIRAGVVLVPEDRKAQGVVLEQTIGENLAFGNFDHVAPKGWVFPKAVQKFAEAGISRLGVKGKPNQAVSKLSGGNQQKVIIAKWVSRPPKVFILDEPTRGIDVGARAAIYDVIADLARSGMAVVVVSSDLEEVLGLSHRVLVLSRGRQRGILERGEASNVAVMELATS